jgi:F-type H+-transporting ATPase subunit a
MAHDPLDHVLDNKTWTFFDSLFGTPVEKLLPTLPTEGLIGHDIQITKYMIIELLAAGLVCAVFIPIARMTKDGRLPKGPFWNLFESFLAFVRNDIAKPSLDKDTDKYVPFLWTLFVFILFCNLLGLVPFFGSPTASIWMTLGLALFSLVAFHLLPIIKMGALKYVSSMWPTIEIMEYPGKTTPMQDLLGLVGIKVDLQSHGHGHGHDDHGHGHGDHGHHDDPSHAKEKAPSTWYTWPLWSAAYLFGLVISLMIFVIELAGTFIKSGVLALRLFVNMFAGHVILASILVLIVTVGHSSGIGVTWGITTVISVLAVTALSVLELFVAFMQAYVFTFLTALFLGMALNPSH